MFNKRKVLEKISLLEDEVRALKQNQEINEVWLVNDHGGYGKHKVVDLIAALLGYFDLEIGYLPPQPKQPKLVLKAERK